MIIQLGGEARSMVGHFIGPERLFYSFNLEDHPPQITLCVALINVSIWATYATTSPIYIADWRPSIGPELMIRMLVVGGVLLQHSLRAAAGEEDPLNLAYRWFCRLSLEDEVPNHSMFSKDLHGHLPTQWLFRLLFNEMLRQCMDAVIPAPLENNTSIDATKASSVSTIREASRLSVKPRPIKPFGIRH